MDKKKIAIVITLAVILILATLYFTASLRGGDVDLPTPPTPITIDDEIDLFEIPTEEITVDPDFEIEIIEIEE